VPSSTPSYRPPVASTYPWILAAWDPFQKMMPEKVGEFVGVRRWLDRLAARPAVQRGMAVPAA
jgi:GST-like protein